MTPNLNSAAPDVVTNGSDASFVKDVIEASRTQPVLVDFWAPWCGPCRELAPALEKAVRKANGAVRLVKINIDENPGIAGQLGVRSIPAVYAFDQGRPVDGFQGRIPDSQIAMFVERLAGADMGEDVTALLGLAEESLKLGDLGGAAQAFASVLQAEPENLKAIAGLARVYLAGGDHEHARQTLDIAPEDKKNAPEIAGVRAALDLAAEGQGLGDLPILARDVAAHPHDHAKRFDLARVLAARGELGEAVDHLLEIISADRAWNEEAARKQLVKIFDAVGPASEISKSGRRRLSSILFS
jgi:putative thioredoxin